MPIIEGFEQIAARVVVEGDESEVVEQNVVGFGLIAQEFWVPAVGLCDREVLEKPRQAQVAGSIAVATGLVGERTGEPDLADA